ncbi:hypothetical protein GCM10012320_04410 [Sinomonas cellulolyticus]|nr:hypothetical protein GCM10012320_04410 [Sinomonas sp. KCTC 49339]
MRPSGNGCDGVTTNARGIVMLLILIAFLGPVRGPGSFLVGDRVGAIGRPPAVPILISAGLDPSWERRASTPRLSAVLPLDE